MSHTPNKTWGFVGSNGKLELTLTLQGSWRLTASKSGSPKLNHVWTSLSGRNIKGTLTSRKSNSVHASMPPISQYQLYSVDSLKYSETLPPKYFVRVIALTPSKRDISLCERNGVISLQPTVEPFSSLVLTNMSYPRSQPQYGTNELNGFSLQFVSSPER